jgi:hypothetical protein
MKKQFPNLEDGVVDGTWNAPGDGVWIIRLDNTHSLLRSKKVFYKVDQAI